MVRFFVSPPDISGDAIRLAPGDSAHIRSLRLRPDERFIVCDGSGTDYVCRLDETGAGAKSRDSRAIIEGAEPSAGEPTVRCTAYIAYAKGDRLDYAVQKSVELGVGDIVLYPSARCVSAPGDVPKRVSRLLRISLETAKQCGRGRVPSVTAADSFESAIAAAGRGARHLPLFFYELEKESNLKRALEGRGEFATASIVTGPEGGFEPFEAELAVSRGLLPVSLGPRILRCETAPVAALAAIMHHTGNL